MIFSLVVITGLEKCCITSVYLQWLCHSGERPVGLLFTGCIPVIMTNWAVALNRCGCNVYPDPMWLFVCTSTMFLCIKETCIAHSTVLLQCYSLILDRNLLNTCCLHVLVVSCYGPQQNKDHAQVAPKLSMADMLCCYVSAVSDLSFLVV